jgi:uncharacterized membrane protein YeaQ/YmgE (transglycosylase-associated protein family)
MFINLIGWALVGLIVGAVAGKVFKAGGDDPKLDLVVGIIGAVIAGLLAGLTTASGVSSFNPWPLAIAPAGAIALLLAWHGFRALATRG